MYRADESRIPPDALDPWILGERGSGRDEGEGQHGQASNLAPMKALASSTPPPHFQVPHGFNIGAASIKFVTSKTPRSSPS